MHPLYTLLHCETSTLQMQPQPKINTTFGKIFDSCKIRGMDGQHMIHFMSSEYDQTFDIHLAGRYLAVQEISVWVSTSTAAFMAGLTMLPNVPWHSPPPPP